MGRQYKYSFEDKIKASKDYISGTRSCRQICLDLGIKYGNTRGGVVRNWAKLYQAFGESIFMDKPHNKSYSADLKLSAVEEYLTGTISQLDVCIKAEKFSVSYTQVYTWVRKYKVDGENGLIDKRGHHKSDDEVDELERLRRENMRLKRQLEEKDMVVELLKKVKEFERRRF